MLVVGEELNFRHTACVLLQVGDEFTRADFPNANFTLHAARADELAACSQTDRSDTTLMGVFNLPEQLAVINSIGSDTAIRPAANNDLICKYCTDWEDTS